jgi:predicted patatin/cPLA2 family phospholipase
MSIKQCGLVLEGGGLRGVYTSGVLRFLMDQDLYFPYVIAVSMGACNAANYISKQPERNRIVNIRYINESRYMSYLRALFKGELFGMNFLFNTIPNTLVPFDFQTFRENCVKFYTVATDCVTGEPIYYGKDEIGKDFLTVLQASCSLPFISKPVVYQGKMLMDGGVADSIPIQKSIDDGNKKNVVILTRPIGYRKKKTYWAKLVKKRYPDFPGICEALISRHVVYNNTLDFLENQRDRGKLFVIQPGTDVNVGRVTRNKDKLYALYDLGYEDASKLFCDLTAYLEK